jgi:hypothetical protein
MIKIEVSYNNKVLSYQTFETWADAMSYCTSLNSIYTTRLLN